MPKSRRGPYGYIGTEHLLLGLLHDPSDLPAQVLNHHGVDLVNARGGVEGIIGERNAAAGHIPFTRRPTTVLEIALREVQRLHHVHIDTGHLLLALEVLFRFGGDLDELEHDVLQQLAGDSSDPARTLRQRVRSSSYSTPDLASAGLAARLDSIDKRLTDIAARLQVIEHHLTDE